MTAPPRDRGAADALGLVILVVPMMAFAVLVLHLGRAVDARAQVRSAAESAAQAAALERDAEQGAAAARATAVGMLDAAVCPDPFVGVVYRDAEVAGDADGIVQVTVRCDLPTAEGDRFDEHLGSGDGLGPGEGLGSGVGDRVEARAFATIDRFRADR